MHMRHLAQIWYVGYNMSKTKEQKDFQRSVKRVYTLDITTIII